MRRSVASESRLPASHVAIIIAPRREAHCRLFCFKQPQFEAELGGLSSLCSRHEDMYYLVHFLSLSAARRPLCPSLASVFKIVLMVFGNHLRGSSQGHASSSLCPCFNVLTKVQPLIKNHGPSLSQSWSRSRSRSHWQSSVACLCWQNLAGLRVTECRARESLLSFL